MLEARSTITSGGRLVIPAAIRKELNLNEGEEVILKVECGELHVLTYKHAVQKAQALVQKYNKKNTSLTEVLFKMRREESDNE
jgi:AbrB family looped-hinge helix DNA binding protein